MAALGPSSVTREAPMRPNAHRVSSAGVPATETRGAARLAVIRYWAGAALGAALAPLAPPGVSLAVSGASPALAVGALAVGALPAVSVRTSSTPTGALPRKK